jgi:hypothetical protein
MTVTLLNVISEDMTGVCEGEMEWDDLYFVKDKAINNQLEKYYNFTETQGYADILLYNKSDATVLIDGGNVFIMRTEDDCPYLEEI